WASTAMAQSFGRDPSRPFAALAAPESLGVSDPGRRTRRSGQSDAARHSPTERPNFRLRRKRSDLRGGAMLVREWKGKLERVTVLEKGFAWNGKSYASLSQIAKAMTGTAWNGHRFFGLRTATSARAAQARHGLVSEATARPDVASAGPTASKQVGRHRSLLSDAVASAAGSAGSHDRGRRRNCAAAAS